MAHEKNHDYHILPPSIWPFIAAVSAFIMLYGSVIWFSSEVENNHPFMFLIGLAGVLYCMYAWWADTITEANSGEQTPVVRIGLRYGFILFIMSEVMFFAAWFWSFFKHVMYPMETNMKAREYVVPGHSLHRPVPSATYQYPDPTSVRMCRHLGPPCTGPWG